ncbi:helix-turn-helix domain-containing protein [Aquabacterium sp.]|uniref:helix-turn-helix domain-containing protein n=1 Tax=Aquabacterium sp. TaxID=1872578 RepID=UPI0024880E5B|nr:helix-turn-helix domain-containing protein [Aquabacterium sp.]MDI1349727.1 helix-turn-helix domain-containing protein [Aquabacterium sp.]
MSDTPPIQLNTPDAGNRGAGEMLRLAREAQGLSLDALAMVLKVTPAKLAALEEGRLEQLPDANFARALAQTVCRYLKVDAAPVLAALPAARPAPLGSDKPPLNQPFKETRLAPHMFDREGGMDLSAVLSLKWLAPLALLLAAAVVYFLPESVTLPGWMQRAGALSAADAASAASAVDAAASEPEAAVGVALGEASVAQAASEPLFGASGALGIPDAAAQASSASAVPSQPVVSAAAASQASPAPQPAGTGASLADPVSGAVVLRATEDAWMEVTDGTGTKRLSRLVKAGETLSMGGVPPWNVRIGNVSGVQVTLRGQPVDLAPYNRNNIARLELK